MAAQTLSKQTQKNWLVDAALFGSALVAAFSGIQTLILYSGGFQGGRNLLFGAQSLFNRHVWIDLHTIGGIAMIAAAFIHLALHWPCLVSLARRTWNELSGRGACSNLRGRWNVVLLTLIASSFALSALSGMYFLFVPGGRLAADPMLLFPRATWDLIHTWTGVVMIASSLMHIAMHWKWVVKVTPRMVGMLFPTRPVLQAVGPEQV